MTRFLHSPAARDLALLALVAPLAVILTAAAWWWLA